MKATLPRSTTLSHGSLNAGASAALNEGASFVGMVEGLTHDFYHYPARFSPAFASAAIRSLSAPGDWVADNFMGGGTTVVQSLAEGRRALGVDINSLAHFIAEAKTTPVNRADMTAIRTWAQTVGGAVPNTEFEWVELPGIRNLPNPIERFMASALDCATELTSDQVRFARAALLRVGQWALDGREMGALRRRKLAEALPGIVEAMLRGMNQFRETCRTAGIADFLGARRLLNRSAIGVGDEKSLSDLMGRVKLCLCSPPYPGVHVLYHRWQHRGRRETPAPYWLADREDGRGDSYYTMGGRSERGIERYYSQLQAAFTSIHPLLARDAHVVQLVAFPDIASHLPRFLASMDAAGFSELRAAGIPGGRIWRQVPNRKWYNRVRANAASEAATEVVLVFTPRRAR